MLEFLTCETLKQEGVLPFYYQARFAHVPNADFDVVLYHPRRPVALSVKTSLRERYKQADLEGLALRQVYRGAESYLLTLSEEWGLVQQKIESGEVTGLTACLLANTDAYDNLLSTLKQRTFELAKQITPLHGSPVTTT